MFFLSKYTYWLSLMSTQSTSTIAGPGSNSWSVSLSIQLSSRCTSKPGIKSRVPSLNWMKTNAYHVWFSNTNSNSFLIGGWGNPFLRQSIKKEEAKFVELPLDQLEERYDRQWLQDRVVSCSLTAVFCWKSVIEILPKHVSSCFEDLTAGVIFEWKM